MKKYLKENRRKEVPLFEMYYRDELDSFIDDLDSFVIDKKLQKGNCVLGNKSRIHRKKLLVLYLPEKNSQEFVNVNKILNYYGIYNTVDNADTIDLINTDINFICRSFARCTLALADSVFMNSKLDKILEKEEKVHKQSDLVEMFNFCLNDIDKCSFKCLIKKYKTCFIMDTKSLDDSRFNLKETMILNLFIRIIVIKYFVHKKLFGKYDYITWIERFNNYNKEHSWIGNDGIIIHINSYSENYDKIVADSFMHVVNDGYLKDVLGLEMEKNYYLKFSQKNNQNQRLDFCDVLRGFETESFNSAKSFYKLILSYLLYSKKHNKFIIYKYLNEAFKNIFKDFYYMGEDEKSDTEQVLEQ